MDEHLILIGEAIILSSIQFSISCIEMSPKCVIRQFTKDQESLQNAIDSLSDYIKIGTIWTLFITTLFYAKHDKVGAIIAILINILIMAWVYFTYNKTIEKAAKANNLTIQ
jgi:hypothetical protein